MSFCSAGTSTVIFFRGRICASAYPIGSSPGSGPSLRAALTFSHALFIAVEFDEPEPQALRSVLALRMSTGTSHDRNRGAVVAIRDVPDSLGPGGTGDWCPPLTTGHVARLNIRLA